MDENQLSTLIDAAVTEAVNRTTVALTAEFDKQVEGLRHSRDTILAEKKALENKPPEETTAEYVARLERNTAETQKRAERLMAVADSTYTKPHTAPKGVIGRDADGTLVIPADVTPQQYREFREQAERDGRPFRVLSKSDARVQTASAPRVHDFEAKGRRYVSTEKIDDLGGPVLARRKLGADVIAFRTLDDLNQDALAAHNAAAGGDDV